MRFGEEPNVSTANEFECENIFTWHNGAESLLVGIFPTKNGTRVGHFLVLNPQTGDYRVTKSTPPCLYDNLQLWYRIAEHLEKNGMTLSALPPANQPNAPNLSPLE